MRLNKYLAQATGMSRRSADKVIQDGRVRVNSLEPSIGQEIQEKDSVTLDNAVVAINSKETTIMLNKPMGYVCSRDGQGSRTIYELLPNELHHLKPVGRLDKNSSGLLLLTNDGQLAHELTHPSFQKTKVYKIALNRPLTAQDKLHIGKGVMLEDGPSKLQLERINDTDDSNWKVTMHEGRNRQIRRTFEALGYNVVKLHRTHFGSHQLSSLRPSMWTELN